MTSSVLGSLALGYQLLWDGQHQLRALRLWLDSVERLPIDPAHVLSLLQDEASAQNLPLILSIRPPLLLRGFLTQADARSPWIEVSGSAAHDTQLLRCLEIAHRKGVVMVWGGEPRQLAESTLRPYLRTLGLDLSVSTRPTQAAHLALRPDAAPLRQLIADIDKDAALPRMEAHLGQDPVLAHRFLLFLNSASLGLRHPVADLRQGLLEVGTLALRRWAQELLAHAQPDGSHRPWRYRVATRARLMTALLEAGEEGGLSEEIYLCGLLSEMGAMLGETEAQALAHLPLSTRVLDALLSGHGPYAPYLEIARLLEAPPSAHLRALCAQQGLDLDSTNRALLHSLRGLHSA